MNNNTEKSNFIQTGGHEDAFSILEDGKIIKKVTEKEYNFYTIILHKHPQLKPFVPEFFGTIKKKDGKYIFFIFLYNNYFF